MVPGLLMAGHSKSEARHRIEICTVGRRMYERVLIVATEGNLSVRLHDDSILTTPAGLCKGTLVPSDLVVTDLESRQLSGSRRFSSELGMHLLIYRVRPDVKAICHAHPPIATGFAAAGRSLDRGRLTEQIDGIQRVPLVPYATPGTPELSSAIEPFALHDDVLLLANHGAVSYGPDLATAYMRMEIIENLAKIILAAETKYVPVPFSERELASSKVVLGGYSEYHTYLD